MITPVSTVLIREAGVVEDDALLEVLDDTERARARRRDDMAAFITAHALQRSVIAEVFDVDPTSLTFERRCATCGSERHGKPSIVDHPEWSFSLSYTNDLAVIALTQAGEVGVDIETVIEADFAGFDQVTLNAAETAAFEGYAGDALLVARATVWSRKEAVLKASGHGLAVDPSQVLVTGPTQEAALVDWRTSEPQPGPVQLHDFTPRDERSRGAVAVLTAEPVTLSVARDDTTQKAAAPPNS